MELDLLGIPTLRLLHSVERLSVRCRFLGSQWNEYGWHTNVRAAIHAAPSGSFPNASWMSITCASTGATRRDYPPFEGSGGSAPLS
jgi:hypothetical protein